MRVNEVFGILTGLVNLGAWYQAAVSESSTEFFNMVSRVAIAWEVFNCGATYLSYKSIASFYDHETEGRFNIVMRAVALAITVAAVRPIHDYINGTGEEAVETTVEATETTDTAYEAVL